MVTELQRLIVFRFILSILFIGLFNGGAYAQDDVTDKDDEPLSCPYCGIWSITEASPSGPTGERIIVSEHSMEVPTCGTFSLEEPITEISVESGRRSYKSRATMQQAVSGIYCHADSSKPLLLEVSVSIGLSKDGGVAEFKISRWGESRPLLDVKAWNFEREYPCDAGGGYGGAQCFAYFNARAYKALAYEAYSAAQGNYPYRLNFNPARFAARVLEFCRARESDSGYGGSPEFWALDCQEHFFEAKLDEFRKWRECRWGPKAATCQRPHEKFDRNAKGEK